MADRRSLPEGLFYVNYIDNYTTCVYACNECKSKYNIIPKNINKNTRCKNCHKRSIINNLENEYLNVKLYNGKNSKSTLVCKECNHEWEEYPKNITKTTKCPECAPKQKIYENNYIKVVYERTDKKAQACCKECNFSFELVPKYIKDDQTSCPRCKSKKTYENEYTKLLNFESRDKKCNAECKKCKHIFIVTPKNMKKDKNHCPKCQRLSELKEVCELENFELIEGDYVWSPNEKYTFKCKGKGCGGTRFKTLNQLKKGRACGDTCDGNTIRAERLAKKYGIKKVYPVAKSNIYVLKNREFIWTCENGHIATFTIPKIKICMIDMGGKWCPTCHSEKVYIKDGSFLDEFAKRNNFTRHYKTYKGLEDFQIFICKNGHNIGFTANVFLKHGTLQPWICGDCPYEHITPSPKPKPAEFRILTPEEVIAMEEKYLNCELSWFEMNSYENAIFIPSKYYPFYIPRHKPPQPKPTKEEIEAKRQDDKDEKRHDKEMMDNLSKIKPEQRYVSLAGARGRGINEEEKRGVNCYVKKKNDEEQREKQRRIAEENAKRIEEKTKKTLKKDGKKEYNANEMLKKELNKDIGEDNETKDNSFETENVEKSSKKVRKMVGFSEEHLSDRSHARNVRERMRTIEDELNSREDFQENKQKELPVKIENFIYDENVTTTNRRVFETLRGRNINEFRRMCKPGFIKRDIIELVVNYGFKDVGLLDQLWDNDETWRINGEIVRSLDMNKLVFDSGNMNYDVIMWCIEKSGSNLTFKDIENKFRGLRDREKWHEEMRKKTDVYQRNFWKNIHNAPEIARPPPRYAHLDDPPETQEDKGSADNPVTELDEKIKSNSAIIPVTLSETNISVKSKPESPKDVEKSLTKDIVQPVPKKIRFRVIQ